jgi:hypothetical protein
MQLKVQSHGRMLANTKSSRMIITKAKACKNQKLGGRSSFLWYFSWSQAGSRVSSVSLARSAKVAY